MRNEKATREFLSQARRYLPRRIYVAIKHVMRDGDGQRPAEIVGNVPRREETR